MTRNLMFCNDDDDDDDAGDCPRYKELTPAEKVTTFKALISKRSRHTDIVSRVNAALHILPSETCQHHVQSVRPRH